MLFCCIKTEIPNGCAITTRLERGWKVTKTNITENYSHDFTLNTCAIPAMVNISHLRLLVDDDGDFSNGGTQCYFNGDGTGITIAYNNPIITVSNISSTHLPNNDTKFITLASIDLATPLGLLLNINTPLPVTACDSYTLPPITGVALVNPQYYSASGGIGPVILVGTVITTSSIIYLYDQTGGTPNQIDEDTLNITINMTQISTDTQTTCDTYTWINGITYTSSNNTAMHTIAGGSINGCDSIITLNLTINNSTNSIDVRSACGTFTWIDGIIYNSSNNTATHTIVGGSTNGCDSIVTLNLIVFPLLTIDLGEDQFICDESVLLSAGGNFNSYLWPDSSTDSTFLATEPGIYSVTVTDINNCPITDNIELIEDCPAKFWVPNVFSPNGDNQNDIFEPILENSESYSMEIYNRWGKSVFKTNSLEIGWDGTSNGNNLSEGTYYFIMEYSFFKQGPLTNEIVKGTVSLLK